MKEFAIYALSRMFELPLCPALAPACFMKEEIELRDPDIPDLPADCRSGARLLTRRAGIVIKKERPETARIHKNPQEITFLP